MNSFRTCVSQNITNVMWNSLSTGFENAGPNRGKTLNDFSEGNILSRTYNNLGKIFISPYETEYCSLRSSLPKVPFYLHFVGKQHEFLSGTEWSSSQLGWNSKSHPTFAQIAQPGLAHLLLSSCSQRTHCSCLFHPCCISDCLLPTNKAYYIHCKTSPKFHQLMSKHWTHCKHIYCGSPDKAAQTHSPL